jgi:membrane protein
MKIFKKNVIKDFPKTLWDYLKKLYTSFDKDHLWILSSGVAFNVVLCIIPFVLILFTVVGIYLGSTDTIQKFSQYLNQVTPLPPEFKLTFIEQLNERANEITGNAFVTGVIGIVGLIWTMSGLFGALRDVLNKIYYVQEGYNFITAKIRDFILVFVTLVLFIISMSVTSGMHIIQYYSIKMFGSVLYIGLLEKGISIFISFLMTFLLFYMLYFFVPHWKYPKKASLFSTFIASILFEITKYGFTLYLLNFSNYTRIYGTYAVLAIILLWIYLISLIFVMCTSLGKIFYDRNNIIKETV